MGLLLAIADSADLSVRQNANDSAVLLKLLQLCFNALSAVRVLSGVLGESLLLGLVPGKRKVV